LQDAHIPGNDPLYSPSFVFLDYGDGSAKNVLAKEATPRRQVSSVFINRTIEAAQRLHLAWMLAGSEVSGLVVRRNGWCQSLKDMG
jgi:hypothetical protein